jgi:hypothetical protein
MRSGSFFSEPLPFQNYTILSGHHARTPLTRLLLDQRLGLVFLPGCFESKDL